MALFRLHGVRCDGCGTRVSTYEHTSQRARQQAKRRGWKRRPGSARSGEDFCSRGAEGKEGLR